MKVKFFSARWPGLSLVLLALLAAEVPAAAQGRKVLEQRLLRAFEKKEPEELERAARGLGPAGLQAALRGRDRLLRVAALSAAARVDGGWMLLGALVGQMAKPDGQMAPAAGRAALRVVENLRPSDLADPSSGLILQETLSEVSPRLAALATRPDLALSLRIEAVRILAQMAEMIQLPSEQELAGLLREPGPQLLEAAAELFVGTGSRPVMDRLALLVARHHSPQVVRAAASALCGGVGPLQAPARWSTVLEALRAAGAMTRLRAEVLRVGIRLPQTIDMARCLRLSPQQADRDAVQVLLRRADAGPTGAILRRALGASKGRMR